MAVACALARNEIFRKILLFAVWENIFVFYIHEYPYSSPTYIEGTIKRCFVYIWNIKVSKCAREVGQTRQNQPQAPAKPAN